MVRNYRIELVLSGVINNQSTFCSLASSITDHVFGSNNEYGEFWVALVTYFKQYNRRPTLSEFIASSKKDFEFTSDVFGDYGRDIGADVASKAFYDMYRHEKVKDYVLQVSDIIASGQEYTNDTLRDNVNDILMKTTPADHDFLEFGKKDPVAYYNYARDFRLEGISATSLRCVNNTTAGGQAVRELLIFMAPPSRGKTVFLVNELYQSLINDEKVLYLSMEDEKENIFGRLADRILVMTRMEQRQETETVEKFISRFFRYVKPPICMYKKPGTFSVEDLGIFIDDYELRTGIHIDTVIVDYLDKLKKDHYKSKSDVDRDRACTDNLRAICVAGNRRGKTAVQTGRGAISRDGVEATNADESDMAGGFGKYETADLVLGFHQTKKALLQSQGTVTMLKARQAGGRGNRYTITMAPWIGLMTDEPFRVLPEEKKHKLENPFIKKEDFIGLTEKVVGKSRKGKDSTATVAPTEQVKEEKIKVSGVQI